MDYAFSLFFLLTEIYSYQLFLLILYHLIHIYL
nr:MAG TPA: hypothetical protein [Caudoviricetes sp.]